MRKDILIAAALTGLNLSTEPVTYIHVPRATDTNWYVPPKKSKPHHAKKPRKFNGYYQQ